MALTLVNLTPHTLNIRATKDGEDILVLPGAGDGAARVSTYRTPEPAIEANGVKIPFVTTKFGSIKNLPNPTKDTAYIVSLVVREAARNTRQIHDLLTPGELVRDDEGNIIACVGLAQ